MRASGGNHRAFGRRVRGLALAGGAEPHSTPGMDTLREHYCRLLGLEDGWSVLDVNLDMEAGRVRILVDWERGRGGPCAECGTAGAYYDCRGEREWRHLDTMQFETVIAADVPRCQCPQCGGVRSMRVPWAGPGSRFTLLFEAMAILLMQKMQTVEAARRHLKLSWESCAAIRARAVERGMARRAREERTVYYIGIDEKSFGRGQSFISVASDPVHSRVLEVEEKRDRDAAVTVLEKAVPPERRAEVMGVVADFWQAYASAAGEVFPEADLIHDRYHVSAYLNEAVDKVRKAEHRALQQAGHETLRGERWLFLMSPEDWSRQQAATFRELAARELKVARAWMFKELFRHFWRQRTVKKGLTFFTGWWRKAKRSKLAPVKEVADMLRRHLPGLLNYITHPVTNGVAEAMNSVIQTLKSLARGFRTFANYRIAILFHCGDLEMLPVLNQPLHTIPR
jgi:transposase